MNDSLFARIRTFIEQHPPPALPADAMLSVGDFRQLGYTPRKLFPAASPDAVARAEAALGLPLPPLLCRLWLEVSNGIAGYAYDLFGLEGGCAGSVGTLVPTHDSIRDFQRSEERPWKDGLLPFCDWGCAIYSCVDCIDPANPIVTFADCELAAEPYTLEGFFEMWLRGRVHFDSERIEVVLTEIINPFTGKNMTVRSRRRKS